MPYAIRESTTNLHTSLIYYDIVSNIAKNFLSRGQHAEGIEKDGVWRGVPCPRGHGAEPLPRKLSNLISEQATSQSIFTRF